MRKLPLFPPLVVWIILAISGGCNLISKEIVLQTESFKIHLNNTGIITSFEDIRDGHNYYAADSLSALMSLKIDKKVVLPESMIFNQKENFIQLIFPGEIHAKIKTKEKSNHITFELLSIDQKDKIDLIIWGPYPTTINKVIGETVGVVQGETFSMGVQALNPKTLGGYPWNENDCMPQLDIFDSGDYSDISEKGKRYVLYRVEAAKPTYFGSTLQAYCRNRTEKRVVENWSHENYEVPAFDDGGIIGSKIALFGCPVENTLQTIEQVEIEENLPHPVLNGKWAKNTPEAASAYMIMGFSEADIDKAIAYTKQAGLKYLYHDGPFENWGHFELKEDQFPNGYESMRNCVEKARADGLYMGTHTLSNFITTNDPYVSPVPDKRLAKVGSSVITESVNETQTEIPVASPKFFNQYKNNNLKTVMIGEELIRYSGVTQEEPWKLLDCQRGSWETEAGNHEKGTTISLLADHGYKVFLTDAELGIEVAKNTAELYNQTGLCQISFDGLEGMRSTGMGNYGEILFTNTWYENLSDEIKKHYIADASRTSHYFWHIYSRMNWGEPWYAGFRESQTEYRLKNQAYFKRNLMPGMLGWFLMKEETSVEDIEWLLARSAGFDAGYAFVTSYKALEENSNTNEILGMIGLWEQARMQNIFSDAQKALMQDINNEFHLEKEENAKFELTRIYSYKFKHEKKVRQPGEPLYSTFEFDSHTEKQNFEFIIHIQEASVTNIEIEVDNFKQIQIPGTFKSGQILKYTGGKEIKVLNKNWKVLKKVSIEGSLFEINQGQHQLTFDCKFNYADKDAMVKIEIRTKGDTEIIQ